MSSAAVQTLWAELVAATLADAGVQLVVLSPGSRSTPLAAAFAAEPRLELVTIIDERAAAFFALGAARASGIPAAVACTSGSAAAHYLPAIVEASAAGVPLVVLTADRPPELLACGANQTIDQVKMYGTAARGAFDLGAPEGSDLALRALRRKIAQAVALSRGPHAGPVHLEVPLRKPLEPAAPATDAEHAAARIVAALRAQPLVAAAPRLVADPAAVDALAAAIAAEPHGVIAAGALPAGTARDAVYALAARTGYPILAETGSQLRLGPHPAAVTVVDHAELVAIAPALVLQLGAEPLVALAAPARYVLAPHAWQDPDSSARGVIIGDLAATLAALTTRVPTRGSGEWAAAWRAADQRAAAALDRALAAHPRNEVSAVRAAIDAAPTAQLQLGNSLPVRVADLAARSGTGPARPVLTQRGASGIDGLVASAAGATRSGPVLLVLGDVSFAHDVGGLLAAREATAPLAIVVVDNAGGRIFDGLPIGRAALAPATYARCFTTPPGLDPVAVARAFGARGVLAETPAALAAAVAAALEQRGPTVIHAPVSPTGAHDVKRTARELLAGEPS